MISVCDTEELCDTIERLNWLEITILRLFLISMAVPQQVASSLLAGYAARTRIPVDEAASQLKLEDAMSVQGLVAKGLGAGVHAWKVAVINNVPAYAPMFDNVVKASGSEFQRPEEGVIIEVEIALRLKSDLPPRQQPYTREEIEASIGELLIGIEFIGSRCT